MTTPQEVKNSRLLKNYISGKIDYNTFCKNYETQNLSERHPITAFLIDDLSYILTNLPIIKSLFYKEKIFKKKSNLISINN